jgi:hypothetical protein
MKHFLLLATSLILLAGCGSKTIPDWTNAAFNQLESYKQSYLSGQLRVAEIHFNKATEEIRKSGNLDLLAKAYLTKCAVQTVAIEKIDDSAYLQIETLSPSPTNKTYHRFLRGDFDQVSPNLLPEQYRSFFDTLRVVKTGDATDELLKMEDPLSRLIAASLAVQHNRCDERCFQVAIDSASKNGWKKPLLVYLEKLQSFYETNKDPEKASVIQKKIELIKK